MTDWDSDPELKALRDDFILSFERRREALATVIQELQRAGRSEVPADAGAGLELRVIAHNLAGSAATYGFAGIGRYTAVLDDYLSLAKRVSASRLVVFGGELDRILKGALANGRNVDADARLFKELISCVESLASAAKP